MGATRVAIHLYVDVCDAMIEKMKAQAGQILIEPTDVFWGDRFVRGRDPFGHEWGIATQLREMIPSEIQGAAAKMFSESND